MFHLQALVIYLYEGSPSQQLHAAFQPVLILLHIKLPCTRNFCVGPSSGFDSVGWYLLLLLRRWIKRMTSHTFHSLSLHLASNCSVYQHWYFIEIPQLFIPLITASETEESFLVVQLRSLRKIPAVFCQTTSAPKMAVQHQNCINKMFI